MATLVSSSVSEVVVNLMAHTATTSLSRRTGRSARASASHFISAIFDGRIISCPTTVWQRQKAD